MQTFHKTSRSRIIKEQTRHGKDAKIRRNKDGKWNKDGEWSKKGNKSYFGYKLHIKNRHGLFINFYLNKN